jgi:hypothetical protein
MRARRGRISGGFHSAWRDGRCIGEAGADGRSRSVKSAAKPLIALDIDESLPHHSS